MLFFFFQAEDGIRVATVTGVQTCALPILPARAAGGARRGLARRRRADARAGKIGRASCRERVYISVVAVLLKKKKIHSRSYILLVCRWWLTMCCCLRVFISI